VRLRASDDVEVRALHRTESPVPERWIGVVPGTRHQKTVKRGVIREGAAAFTKHNGAQTLQVAQRHCVHGNRIDALVGEIEPFPRVETLG